MASIKMPCRNIEKRYFIMGVPKGFNEVKNFALSALVDLDRYVASVNVKLNSRHRRICCLD
jgi:hypothetical protein